MFCLTHLRAKSRPGGASGKEPACQCRRWKKLGSVPGLGRSSGGRHGNPLQYSYLENPRVREIWWATVHRVSMSWTGLKRLSTSTQRLLAEYIQIKKWNKTAEFSVFPLSSKKERLFHIQAKKEYELYIFSSTYEIRTNIFTYIWYHAI